MSMTAAALRTELQTDPAALGYAALVASGNDAGLASLLNAPRAGIAVRRADISTQELAEAILVTDFTALPANPTAAQLSSERRYLAWLTGLLAGSAVRLLNDDGTDTPVVANLKAIFAAGTGTHTRLVALASRQGSRAEQLWGRGATVGASDVAAALRGGG